MTESARLQAHARGFIATIGEIGRRPFPGCGIRRRHSRAGIDINFHISCDLQLPMWVIELRACDQIPKCVHFIAIAVGPGSNGDLVLNTALIAGGSRHEMKQLVRVNDIAFIPVDRLVANAVAYGIAHLAAPHAPSPMLKTKSLMWRSSAHSS